MTLAEYSRPSRVGYASQQGAGSAPVKVNRIVTVQGSNLKQREMCLHCAGSAPVKVNRTFTVQGSNPKQREMCLHFADPKHCDAEPDPLFPFDADPDPIFL
jgi:hypothetical protein